MRKDARLNREKLLEAARALFAERGLDVPLNEVARRAGVSIGTLYNRFPDRTALSLAVYAEHTEAVVRSAERALEMADAWAGFTYFLERLCLLQAADKGFNEYCASGLAELVPGEELRRGYTLMGELVAAAQRAGALRADFVTEDLAFVTWSVARTIEATAGVAPEAWRRHLALMCDGLRRSAATPLPAPPLRPEQAASIVHCAADRGEAPGAVG
ncbi:TetR/AcrR family transcriptional regulator [Streptomyces sp. AM 3-1-1]|uniref:TetR/AcrR family transcriptional regulator n=1 Tax=Streptomyces sp. AM 3-1-1 TaxID=3028711 RepID=UPI0023B9C794|nr:TetR/AcrR family transcriptional regulator [Streptomyces sp. AM 3-1-1]WEH26267.1 helix-turn-helix domain containing protein [Streptomyces sp. AM 3-1-1]